MTSLNNVPFEEVAATNEADFRDITIKFTDATALHFELFRVYAFAVLTETKDYCGWGTCHLDLKHFSLNFGSLL